MTRSFLLMFLLIAAIATTATAGTIEGKVSPGKSVVYVDTIPGKTFPAPAQKPLLSQQGLMFNPHLLVVEQGDDGRIPETTHSVQHNVLLAIHQRGLTRKRGPQPRDMAEGEKRDFKFDQPGVGPLLCNVHSEMSGYIIVSPTPYFAETDANGNYKIDNIPDGKYNVVAWHEGMKP